MHRSTVAAIAAATALALGSAVPAAAQHHDHSAAAAYSTAATDIGTLLADPAAKAVVAKYIPDFASNPQVAMASGMTLRQVAPMSPQPISDATLTKIDADLAKLRPVRK